MAENALRKKKVEIAEGKFLDVRRQKKLKFEDFADEYFELHSEVNNKSWRRTDRHNIKINWENKLGTSYFIAKEN